MYSVYWTPRLNPIPINLLSHHLRLLDVSLKSANANDKVKSNIVRALGNLLRFMKQSTYDKVHFKEYVTKSVECLLKCCTSGGQAGTVFYILLNSGM